MKLTDHTELVSLGAVLDLEAAPCGDADILKYGLSATGSGERVGAIAAHSIVSGALAVAVVNSSIWVGHGSGVAGRGGAAKEEFDTWWKQQ
jgi:hypothetical protein